MRDILKSLILIFFQLHFWLSGGQLFISPMISSLVVIGKCSAEVCFSQFISEAEFNTFKYFFFTIDFWSRIHYIQILFFHNWFPKQKLIHSNTGFHKFRSRIAFEYWSTQKPKLFDCWSVRCSVIGKASQFINPSLKIAQKRPPAKSQGP